MTELAKVLNEDQRNKGQFALYIMQTFEDVNGKEFTEAKLTNTDRSGFCNDLKNKLDLIMFDLMGPHPEQKEKFPGIWK